MLVLNQTTAVLMVGYSKAEKEDLTADELKRYAAEVAVLLPQQEE